VGVGFDVGVGLGVGVGAGVTVRVAVGIGVGVGLGIGDGEGVGFGLAQPSRGANISTKDIKIILAKSQVFFIALFLAFRLAICPVAHVLLSPTYHPQQSSSSRIILLFVEARPPHNNP